MKNKILLLICAFFLVCINVNAAHTCEYKSNTGNTIKIIKQSDGQYTVSGAAVVLSSSVKGFITTSGCNAVPTLYINNNTSGMSTLDSQCNDCSYNDNFLYVCNCLIRYSLQNEYGSNDAGDKNGGGSGTSSGKNLLGNDWATNLSTDECPSIFGSPSDEESLFYLLKNYIFSPVRIITPIILILLTSLDFAKAIFADEKDGMKKAKGNFIKRAAAALIIFLAPTIVSFLISLVDYIQVDSCVKQNNSIVEDL